LPLLAVHFRDHFENGLFRDLWWAQDGALAHRLLEVRDRLNGVFGNESRNLMLCGITLTLLLMQRAICKREQHFVFREMDDTLKDTVLESQ
jgi:hypothetical protein